ncbi:hypothetical protein M422DRAFT_164527, partial [Sphaerobolus stellatus SS14]
TIPLFVLFNKSDIDHVYTISEAERDSYLQQGFIKNGIVGYVYPKVTPWIKPVAVAVYTVYDPDWKDHLYTQGRRDQRWH